MYVLLAFQEKEHNILYVRILTPFAFRPLWGNRLNFDLLCSSRLPSVTSGGAAHG